MVYFVQILYTILFKHCQSAGMKNGDEVSPSIILASQALLVKLLIPLDRVVHLVQTLYTYVFLHCSATDMQNGDEASKSIIRQIKLF